MSGSGHPFPIWTPPEIISTYSEKGINCLFDWQTEVLDWAEESDDNIVYCAPTSAGKSLVAELIGTSYPFLYQPLDLSKSYLCSSAGGAHRQKGVVSVTVYFSCEGKVAISSGNDNDSLLQRAWRRVDIQMAAFVGPQSAPSREWTAAICTTEKANSLLNHAILDGLINEIGLIVVDELHMIFDSSRGIVLESLCSKINLWNSRLAAEGIFLRKLVLVFSSSKADVEKIALDLAKILDGIYRSNHVIASRVDRSALSAIQSNIQKATGTVDAVLLKTLPRGVAFHHAGLTSEERECIEQGFRDGTIMVLVATSTLSSGVNLPAGRVVIKSQVRGPAAINATTYKQMSGRAGRLGQVEIGFQ
ncbi:helicase protein [Necator americanus]|uniref:Helicase protein n=1 Tax=Necator americanus TaxID=51031 RepID=W2SZG4_NECAM|nr:helicase protein [Necator americanus]ETN74366.1 helicase protein [Necator americanus]